LTLTSLTSVTAPHHPRRMGGGKGKRRRREGGEKRTELLYPSKSVYLSLFQGPKNFPPEHSEGKEEKEGGKGKGCGSGRHFQVYSLIFPDPMQWGLWMAVMSWWGRKDSFTVARSSFGSRSLVVVLARRRGGKCWASRTGLLATAREGRGGKGIFLPPV